MIADLRVGERKAEGLQIYGSQRDCRFKVPRAEGGEIADLRVGGGIADLRLSELKAEGLQI